MDCRYIFRKEFRMAPPPKNSIITQTLTLTLYDQNLKKKCLLFNIQIPKNFGWWCLTELLPIFNLNIFDLSPFILSKHLGSPRFLRGPCCSSFYFSVCCDLLFVVFVLCTQCCYGLWIDLS